MSQTLDMLLSIDPERANKRPTKKIEISRLSKLAGAPVLFTIQALDIDEAYEITGMATKEDHYSSKEASLFIVLAGVIDPNLKDKKLLEKFSAATPKELVKKLLLSGEITGLSDKIGDLSGLDSNGGQDEEAIKN